MKVAVAIEGGRVSSHFGDSREFVVFTVVPEERRIISSERLVAPAHAPGVFPRWLCGLGVDVVLAGGMGSRARAYFARAGVEAVTGVPPLPPEVAVERWLKGELAAGENSCDRGAEAGSERCHGQARHCHKE